MKKALFSLVACMAILAPVAAQAANDPSDPFVAQPTANHTTAVHPMDWTAPSPFTIFPPNA